jgi:Holliday junction resolvasome RuvABC ATP-dependent DNA helicase subunit
MKNYLKKDGTLEKKAIDLISILRSGKFVKLSNFYSSRSISYPMVLNSDLFIIVSDKETIINEGFFSTTKAIVKINKENKYVEQTLKELEEQDIKKKEAKELFEKMLCEAKTFIADNKELIDIMVSKHGGNPRGLQKIAWVLSLKARDNGIFVTKTAFFRALKSY